MPRVARKRSASKIYHIITRGINKQTIFEDNTDYSKFMNILVSYKQEINFELYAYVLMGNHVHLLLKEGDEDVSNTMKRVGSSYVQWFNWQYDRKGHLFQDRFRSEPVETDAYLLTALRYIHQNPVKAGVAKGLTDYNWSSYAEYIGKEIITDTGFVLDLFDKNRDRAIQRFIKFNNEVCNDNCLETIEPKKTISDSQIKIIISDKFNLELITIQNQNPTNQKEIIRYLKGIEGTSLRQLSRLTGLAVHKIYRA